VPLPEGNDPADLQAVSAMETVELRPDVERAIADLPAEYRAAVVLADLEGLGLTTVSEILGVPVGTVKSRVFRGRRLLAETLGNLRGPARSPRDEEHA
jgi:RNA polymerase sigma-70 factor (ECF subfamily)